MPRRKKNNDPLENNLPEEENNNHAETTQPNEHELNSEEIKNPETEETTPEENNWLQFNGVKVVQANNDPNEEPVIIAGWQKKTENILFHHVESFAFLDQFLESDNRARYPNDEAFLWEPLWVLHDNKYPSFRWQHTGSCVESGYNNAVKVLLAQEIIYDKLPKVYLKPFTFHVYGLSRYIGLNTTSEGEGSLGESMAEAGNSYGILPEDFPDVDKAIVCGPADCYGAAVEYKWSGISHHPQSIKMKKFPYLVKFVHCSDLQEAEKALRNGFPLTWAGSWGGSTKAQIAGSKYPVLFMTRRQTWYHQQCCLGVWKHPELGRIWYIQNSWWEPNDTKYELRNGYIWRVTSPGTALPLHGQHPKIDVANWNHPPFPPGGYWISDKDMLFQIRNGEVFALVLFDGFKNKPLSFGNI